MQYFQTNAFLSIESFPSSTPGSDLITLVVNWPPRKFPRFDQIQVVNWQPWMSIYNHYFCWTRATNFMRWPWTHLCPNSHVVQNTLECQLRTVVVNWQLAQQFWDYYYFTRCCSWILIKIPYFLFFWCFLRVFSLRKTYFFEFAGQILRGDLP